MSKTKAIEMIENIMLRHSLCGMRKAELQDVIDELRKGSPLEGADDDREIPLVDGVARALEALERRVKALEEEAAERMDEPP